MKSFFTSLLYASVIGGIGAALVGKAYRKHLQALAALLCTALIVSPLIGLIPSFKLTAPQYEDTVSVDSQAAESLIIRQAEQDAEAAMYNYIFSETGIKARSISISFESKEQGLALTYVYAETETEEQAQAVKALITESFGSAVTAEVRCEG